jgi:hypothetical protein
MEAAFSSTTSVNFCKNLKSNNNGMFLLKKTVERIVFLSDLECVQVFLQVGSSSTDNTQTWIKFIFWLYLRNEIIFILYLLITDPNAGQHKNLESNLFRS